VQQFVVDVEARQEGSVLGRRLADHALVRIYSSLAHWLDALGEDDPKHRYIARAGASSPSPSPSPATRSSHSLSLSLD
jgi:hypothetical protein